MGKAVVEMSPSGELGNRSDELDNKDKEVFINKYGGLIKYMAQRLAMRLPSSVSVDDLVAAGMIGFIDALEKFDPSRNVKFRTYMEIRVKGAMMDELRAMDPVSRATRRKAQEIAEAYDTLEKTFNCSPTDQDVAKYLKMELEDFYRLLDETKSINILPLEYTDYENKERSDSVNVKNFNSKEGDDPCYQLQKKELLTLLATSLEKLPEKEKLVVTLYYYEQLTMKEIGELLNISESRVSQIHSSAMIRLRYKLGQFTC